MKRKTGIMKRLDIINLACMILLLITGCGRMEHIHQAETDPEQTAAAGQEDEMRAENDEEERQRDPDDLRILPDM